MDEELFPGFGSEIIVPDPDPAKNERENNFFYFYLKACEF